MEPEARTRGELNVISVSIAGFASGIFFASFVLVVPLIALLGCIVGVAIFVVERRSWLIALALVSFSLGVLRYDIKDFHQIQTPSSAGVVVDEPLDTENTRRFTFEADNGERVVVSAPLYTDVVYGNRVEVKGNFKRPGIIEDENGRSFDYGAYLSKDDIYWTMSFAEVNVLAKGVGNPLKTLLLNVKNNFVAHIESILSEPQASLLAGFLVAGKGGVPESVLEDFRRAGVVHIVVLSGFNVTLVAVFLRKIFEQAFLLAGIAAVPLAVAGASVVGIVLFVLMTGASATVVRAAAMALIALLAKHLGRSFSASRALLLAAFVMLLFNPKLLVFDPSFQLSFLATLGLIYFMPPVEKFLSRGGLPEWGQFKEILSQTIATQLAVLPLLVYSTGNVSLASLPANLAILPLVPFAMLIGFAATLLSYASVILAWPISFITHILLSFILALAHLFSSLPFAIVKVPAVSGWALLVALLIASLLMLAWRSRNSLRSFASSR